MPIQIHISIIEEEKLEISIFINKVIKIMEHPKIKYYVAILKE